MRNIKVVFLDRDGVINKYPGDREYVTSWGAFSFLPNVKPALKKLSEHGFRLFIVSNQAGVSKGIYPQENLDVITKNMLKELSGYNVVISDVYYCTHRPEDNCNCRKPKTGLLNQAISKLKQENLKIDFKESYFVGDTIRDIETGRSAGLKTILVFSGKEKPENKNNWQTLPDFSVQNLSAAADLIIAFSKNPDNKA
jgi:D-glycero-D-manno-heptose 1,7-bisphosphate phosphatase